MSHPLSLNAQHRGAECRAQDLECRIARIADAGRVAIEDRLAQLDEEWSAGRVSKAVLAAAILAGTVLMLTVSWWWAVVPVAAGALLLQYMFTRMSWMVTTFATLGFRPKAEIEHEKFALRTLRGDYRHLPTVHDIEADDDISRLEGEGGIVVEVEARKVNPLEAAKEVIQATTPV